MASPPKQKHSRVKSHQLHRLLVRMPVGVKFILWKKGCFWDSFEPGQGIPLLLKGILTKILQNNGIQ